MQKLMTWQGPRSRRIRLLLLHFHSADIERYIAFSSLELDGYKGSCAVLFATTPPRSSSSIR